LKRRTRDFDEILEIEVRKETLMQTEHEIKANVAKFADSLKMSSADFHQDVKPKAAKLNFKGFKQAFPEAAAVQAVDDQKVERRQPVKSADEDQVQLAYAKFQILKEQLGGEAVTLRGITLDKLRRSQSLRSFILDSDIMHFYATENPKGSFVKEDETYIDKMQKVR
jgi:hypothetical protein